MIEIKIGFDIDGVALKYTERLNEVFYLFGGKTDISNPKEYNFFNCIEDSERDQLLQATAYTMNEELYFYDDFASTIPFFLKRNKILRFVTSRKKSLAFDSAKESIERPFEYDILSYGFDFTIDCVEGSKLPKNKEYGFEYFVDDKRETCLELSKAGIFVFMPRRSYNYLPPTEHIYQYDNANEIVRFFE